ncbi:MAG: cysteine-rich CWC family protein [Rubrivivax sp.]|nr:cysteine-rich CWC family protein [Rubrivivax sp.]
MGADGRVKRAGGLAALPAPLCPLCGQPNDCAPARCGDLDTPCWCRDVRIAPEALARVPPALRNRACLCRRCAGAEDPAAPSG